MAQSPKRAMHEADSDRMGNTKQAGRKLENGNTRMDAEHRWKTAQMPAKHGGGNRRHNETGTAEGANCQTARTDDSKLLLHNYDFL